MLLEVISAKYLEDYRLFLTFNNGYRAVVDLHDVLMNEQRPIFQPLREPDYFQRFSITFNTIAWENEADFAPEFLYALAKQQQGSKHQSSKRRKQEELQGLSVQRI